MSCAVVFKFPFILRHGATLLNNCVKIISGNGKRKFREQISFDFQARHYSVTSSFQQSRKNNDKPKDLPYFRPYIDAKHSYVYGRSNYHFQYSNVHRFVNKIIQEKPDRLAIISQTENIRKTFRQLNHDINRVIKGLIYEIGISKGDYVAVYSYNCYKWPLIQLACNLIGAIIVPINPSNKPEEFVHIMEKARIKLLLLPGPKSTQSSLNDHFGVLNSGLVRESEKSGKLHLKNVITIDNDDYSKEELLSYGWCLQNASQTNWSKIFDNDGDLTNNNLESNSENALNEFDFDRVTPEDIMGIYFTSGTTGKPKGACISNFTAINNVAMVQRRIYGRSREWEKNRILCNPLPMFHIFAGVLNTFGIFYEGTTIVYTGARYDIETILKAIMENLCNVLVCTPTILIDLLALVEKRKLALPLKTIQCGGAPLKPEIVRRAHDLLPHLENISIGYGSTENGGVSTVQTIHEPVDARPFSVGPPMDFTEVRIVDTQTGYSVELGQEGEVQTRGHNTMIEYIEDPEKTEEVITLSGWYRTGDMGKLLPHGSLQISGRIKELIIKGGENIYPKEVEELLSAHDSIEDAHVVGVPDDRYGEEICVWVKLRPGHPSLNEKEIREYCKSRITYFKVPKYILIVDTFPMTATKKAQKHIMREKTIEMLNLKT